jgi:hypothetical protein
MQQITQLVTVSQDDACCPTAACRLSQQMIGWLLLHVFDDPGVPLNSEGAKAHVISDLVAPILERIGEDSATPQGFDDDFKSDYLKQIWTHCSVHLDLIARKNPIHLIEAGAAHIQSLQFDKWAECIMKALVFCVPEPSECCLKLPSSLVPQSFFSQERRAILTAVTEHLTRLFSVQLNQKPSHDIVSSNESDLEMFAAMIDRFRDPFSPKSWFKSYALNNDSPHDPLEVAHPKLQYILQMLAVARAFQAQADAFAPQDVLGIVTGRFGMLHDAVSSAAHAPQIFLPVVAGYHEGACYFFRNADSKAINWLLPPYDDVQGGQPCRLHMHPAVCRNGDLPAAHVFAHRS